MLNKLGFKLGLLVLFIIINIKVNAQSPCDKICGKWGSAEKNLIVQVYRDTGIFKAKIIWFDAGSDKLMKEWLDKNNPDKALRSRKMLGMSVLSNLVYEAKSDSWENGTIYDARHGRYWNASAYIDKEGLLKVKGYWHFKFIGRTMTFNSFEKKRQESGARNQD